MSGVRFDAVIFDLDGTLADSLADIGGAMNRLLASLALPAQPLESYKHFVGEGAEHLVRRAVRAAQGLDWQQVDDDALPQPLAQLTDRYRVQYDGLQDAASHPYAGIPELLDALTAAGKKLAVLSNKRDDFTRRLVARTFGRWRFADVRGEREGVPRKPDPTAAFELSLALNVLPERIAFVGDTAIDMGTALRAGMIGVGVLWGFRDRRELEAAGARAVIAHPSELLTLG